jgi:hypothetical protein
LEGHFTPYIESLLRNSVLVYIWYCYLQETKDYILTFRKSDNLKVIDYSNSDFSVCIDNKKSTSCYIFILTRGSISCKSAKQSIITSSTMQAEFMACYEANGQAV